MWEFQKSGTQISRRKQEDTYILLNLSAKNTGTPDAGFSKNSLKESPSTEKSEKKHPMKLYNTSRTLNPKP